MHFTIPVIFYAIAMVCIQTEDPKDSCEAATVAFQEERNTYFADSSKSPLEPEDFASFEGASYFPYSADFCVITHFEPLLEKIPTTMVTSKGEDRLYLKAGWLSFEIEGTICKLAVYERPSSLGLKKSDTTIRWFLPFKDATNGETTYGGGRYMDVEGRSDAGSVSLNFNTCYPPYCAFSNRFSCPIVPNENYLDVAITAGVMSR
jgi:uncharacterized protein (DUF1684 family)